MDDWNENEGQARIKRGREKRKKGVVIKIKGREENGEGEIEQLSYVATPFKGITADDTALSRKDWTRV